MRHLLLATAGIALITLFYISTIATQIRSHQGVFGTITEPISLEINAMPKTTTLTTTWCWKNKEEVIFTVVTTTTQEPGETPAEHATRHDAAVTAAQAGKLLVTCP